MSRPPRKSPLCIIIAGPNGAGKTTFAREFLPKHARRVRFVNADLIAKGLSQLRPELAAVAAGRLFLREVDRLAKARVDFAFQSTLSGLGLCETAETVESRRLSPQKTIAPYDSRALRYGVQEKLREKPTLGFCS